MRDSINHSNRSALNNKPAIAKATLLEVASREGNLAPSGPRAVFAADIIGYLFLCCSRKQQHIDLKAGNSSVSTLEGLKVALNILNEQNFNPKTAIEGKVLQHFLNITKISIDMWNSVVNAISKNPNGREILDKAKGEGQAAALGLPLSASERFRKVEKRLSGEQFDVVEHSRVFQLIGVHSSADLDPKTNRITLHQIRLNPMYDLPPDAFSKFQFNFGWFLGALLSKTIGFIDQISGKGESENVVRARNHSWNQPIGSSVLSPTIKSLISNLASDAIETEITPIASLRGCSLQIKMMIKKGALPGLRRKS
jgi:hypothetical protein